MTCLISALDAMPSELKYYYDYMLNFSLGAKRKFSRENLLRCKNTIDTHARAPFQPGLKNKMIKWIFQPPSQG